MIAPVPKTLLQPGVVVRVGTDGCMVRGVDSGSPWFMGGSLAASTGACFVGNFIAVGCTSPGSKKVNFIALDKISLPLDIPANWDAACRWVWRTAGGSALAPGESAPRLYRLPCSQRWRLESAAGDVLHFRGVEAVGDTLVPGLAGVTDPAEALALIVKALS